MHDGDERCDWLDLCQAARNFFEDIDTGSSVRRAAAIDGVGMLLGKAPPLELSQISRSSDFTLFGGFEHDLFQVTL
jgi:hypothetical protein